MMLIWCTFVSIAWSQFFPFEGHYCSDQLTNAFNTSDLLLIYNGTTDDGVLSSDVQLLLSAFFNNTYNYILLALQENTSSFEIAYATNVSTLFTQMGDNFHPSICTTPPLATPCIHDKYCVFFIENYGMGFTGFSNMSEEINVTNTGYDSLSPADTNRYSWSFLGDGAVRSGTYTYSGPSNYFKAIYMFVCKNYFDDNTCKTCIDGYYLNITCYKCSDACETCVDLGPQNCQICSSSYSYFPLLSPYFCLTKNGCQDTNCLWCFDTHSSGQCMICNDGYLINVATYTCEKCPAPCDACYSNSSTNCSSCVTSFYINDPICKPCHPACLTCYGAGADQCYDCSPSYSSGEIVDNFTCTSNNCIGDCKICLGPAIADCIVCLPGFAITFPSVMCTPCINPCATCSNEITCLSCIDGFYLDGSICMPCSSNCKTCDDIGFEKCIDCADDFTTEITDFLCTSTFICFDPVHCMNCVGVGEYECVKCIDGYVLDASSGPYSCVECPDFCETCLLNSANSCSSCQQHYYLNNWQCLICDEACLDCTAGLPTNCQTCAPFYSSANIIGNYNCTITVDCEVNCEVCIRNATYLTGHCLKCADTFYLTNSQMPSTCSSCPPNCVHCTGSDEGDCTECVPNCIFDAFKNCRSAACFTNCEVCANSSIEGCTACFDRLHFNSNNICVTDENCGANCQECLLSNDDSKCTLCANVNGISYFLFNSQLISYCVTTINCALNCKYCTNSTIQGCLECKNGYFQTLTDKRCVTNTDCGANCQNCYTRSNSIMCVSCLAGYSLYNGLALTYCVHTTSCATGCHYCIGSTLAECIECSVTYFLFNGKCVTSLNCGLNCDYCTEINDDSKCVKCLSGYALYNGSAVSYCSTQLCLSTRHCLYCINNSPSGCLECESPYHLNRVANVCILDECFTNCKYCLSSDKFSCIECSNSSLTFLYLSPSICGYSTICQENCNFCLSEKVNDCITCKLNYFAYTNSIPSYCSTQVGCQDLCTECLNSTYCIQCKNDTYLDSDKLCKINCTEGYKFTTTLPHCKEICGDGKNFGSYECDDGNILDGDGCDHSCMKESNAICNQMKLLSNCIVPSYTISFVEGMYKLRVQFNYEVGDFSQYLKGLYITVKDNVSIPVVSVDIKSSYTFELLLYLDNITLSGSDVISVVFPSAPKYVHGNQSIGTNTISKSVMPTQAQDTQLIPLIAQLIGDGIMIASMIILVAKTKQGFAIWEYIDTCQVLTVLGIVNVHKVPSYMQTIFSIRSYFMASFIPKALSFIKAEDKFYSNETIFDKASTLLQVNTTSIIVNASFYFIIIIGFIFIFTLILLIKKNNGAVFTNVQRIKSFYHYAIPIRLTTFLILPFSLCAFMQLRNMQMSVSPLVGIGALLSVLALLAIMAYTFTISVFINKKRNNFELAEFRTMYGQIYEPYSNIKASPYTALIIIIRKLIISSAILFPQNALLQCGILFTGNVLYFTWMCVVRPFKYREDTICTIASEACIIISNLIVFSLYCTVVFMDYYAVVNMLGIASLLGALYFKSAVCLIKAIKAIRESKAILPINTKEDVSKTCKNEYSIGNDDSRIKDETYDKTIQDTKVHNEKQYRNCKQIMESIQKIE